MLHFSSFMSKPVLVTAALPYINNVPHMGHIVGSHLPADIFYRYHVAKGNDAALVGGSDEHGTPSVLAAKELGVSPRFLVDKLHSIHQAVYEKFNIAYTKYSRTSDPRHHQQTQEFFRKVQEKGLVHSGEVEMLYCTKDDMFLPDRFVVGTCPKCDYDSANADQCEKCTSVLTPRELKSPHCKSCGSTPSFKGSTHLYLDLGKLAGRVGQWVESQKDVWRPHVYAEAKRWIDEGLKSRAITRDMSWGVKVPGLENKVFYVWFDAPIAYTSFTRELGEETFEKYWKNPKAEVYNFLGKDNIPFHTIFWPAMLLAHGDLNLPKNVAGFNYLNFRGQKVSKSRGTGVFCYNLLDSNVDVDVLRAYLTTAIPESKDSDFSWDSFRANTNGELIAKLGNFFNRTLSVSSKNFGGRLDFNGSLSQSENDLRVIDAVMKFPDKIGNLFAGAQFRDAYREIMNFASEGNGYLERAAPWTLIKNGRMNDAKRALYLGLNLCRSLAIVAAPILPNSMQRVWSEQLRFQGKVDHPGIWDTASEISVPLSHQTAPPAPLYGRIEEKDLERLEQHFSRPHTLTELVKG